MPVTERREVFDPTNPAQMSPEQRLTEAAAILAAGVLRMRRRYRSGATSPALVGSDSVKKGLEFLLETSPDGQRG
jgi:hypothetical protein